MEHKICEYCGTEYDAALDQCPLCGKESQPPEEEPASRPKRGGTRLAPKQDRIPRGLQVVICIVLGLAVVIGAVFAISNLTAFSKDEPKQDDSNLTLPIGSDADEKKPDDKTPDSDDPDAKTPDDSQVTAPTTPDVPPVVVPDPPEVECTRLVIDRTDVTFKEAKESFVLKADVYPTDCTQPVTFTSQDESLCKVDEDGRVTAVNGKGTTEVVVTCGEKSQSCIVRCNFPYDPSVVVTTTTSSGDGSRATLSSEDISMFTSGETAKLTVKNAPADAEIVWASSDPSVATVVNGTVTAISSGTVDVTAQVGDKTLRCIVRCKLAGTAPATNGNAETGTSVSLSHTDVFLFTPGESFTISVQGSSGAHTWTVSDPSVCSVDADGKVTALSSGTATVSTTVGDKTLSCIVRVK